MPSQTFFNLPDVKRQIIIDAAIDELANHSYEAASISNIVNQAKIAKGSFYQYFENKEDLYLYLVDQALETKRAFIARANLPSIQAGFFVYLRALFQAVLEFQLAHPALTQILHRGPHHGNVPFREEVFKRTRIASISFMRQCVQEAIAQGQLAADINPDVTAFTIVTLGNELRRFIPVYLGINANQLVKDGPVLDQAAIGEVLDDFIRTLERGIGGSP
ncbi:TetR/AcrR family transcriptional regulator (plasmid) [Phormidium sp. CLA17]|uniref:TetR/AcrR family transcriptional regulator n=1 Tax=Leptolyngbya sp. Cla-17 TaxID=2803751 RepID=UPI0014925ED0|nr:TetR/AcrR family transcriptional regulator [Leptolyngbya sp. Cla-17]MBM0745095.1 TetR/AcrR family transcriptional regulator [Leptolyngbya sp. Cla-17]